MNRGSAIGIFDSGLGGLTAVKEMIACLPSENIIYFGDTGRVPYGTRSKETVIKYVRQDIRFFMKFDIKVILFACGTATSIALPIVKDEFDIPIIGVVQASADAAVKVTNNNKIAVIGTPGTISSGAYERILTNLNSNTKIISKACPLFVPMVEDGRFMPNEPIVKIMVEEYLKDIKDFGADTLILGCTHYPMLIDAISFYLGEKVNLINSGAEGARLIHSTLISKDLLNNQKKSGLCKYFVSDNVYNFSKIGGYFLQHKFENVEKIDIENY